MTELETFMAGGGTALCCWAIGLILAMGKASSGENSDF